MEWVNQVKENEQEHNNSNNVECWDSDCGGSNCDEAGEDDQDAIFVKWGEECWQSKHDGQSGNSDHGSFNERVASGCGLVGEHEHQGKSDEGHDQKGNGENKHPEGLQCGQLFNV